MKTKTSERTLFFKPSHPEHFKRTLDPVVVGANQAAGVETTIVLDTNVIVKMEKVVKAGNKWAKVKEFGLDNLVKLLSRCPPRSVAVSPGMGLIEMPPAKAAFALECYDIFFSTHLPGFADAPNCIRSEYKGKDKDYGFFDLPEGNQDTIAIPFTSLIHLNIVQYKFKGTPIDKFKEYLRRAIEDISYISLKEAQIAKYCFSDPSAHHEQTILTRRLFTRNFLKDSDEKPPKTSSDVFKIAFNGACDLHLINSATVIDSKGMDNVHQDCWIATFDKKLFEFSKTFSYLAIPGDHGKFGKFEILDEQVGDNYWVEATEFQKRLASERREMAESRDVDIGDMRARMRNAIEECKRIFDNDSNGR